MNKKSLIILIISISSLLLIIVGATYAYLKTTAIQSDSNVISTLNCLEVTIEDVSTPITVSEAYPITDAEGLQTTPYRFKLKNTCTTQVGVDINLETLTGNSSTDLFYYVKYSIDRYGAVFVRDQAGTTKYASGTDARRLKYVSMNPNEERVFELRLWISSTATFEQAGNKTYQAKVVAVAYPVYYPNKASAPSEWSGAASNTLLAAIRDGNYMYADPLSVPGRAGNGHYENLIGHTEDDYGTSYYFRGNVGNNYVIFANMCWQIVRVTGKANNNGDYNNAIKLILTNNNINNVSNPCDLSEVNDKAFYALYDNTANGQEGISKFNASRTSNAYIGFMYGNPSGSTYEETHANTTDSVILTNLKKWYDLVFTTAQKNMLADVIWCNDKSLSSTTTGTGSGTVSTRYAGSERIDTASTANPTLICPDATTNNSAYKKIGKYTGSETTFGNGALNGYKIGLITADEVAFAGTGITYNSNGYGKTHYLWSRNKKHWWTMTPFGFEPANYPYVYWDHRETTALSRGYYVDSNWAIRPMIALKATTTIVSGGDGSAHNPFVVN